MKLKPFSMAVFTIAAVALLLNVVPMQSARGGPSIDPEMDRQAAIVEGISRTRAIVVAKLFKRRQSRDEAYLVFDVQRVAWGVAPRKLFAVQHPELTEMNCGTEAYHVITQDDLDALKEGATFLLVMSRNSLLKWVAVSKDEVDKVIEDTVKPHVVYEDSLKLDPWLAAQNPDSLVRATLLNHFSVRATRDECMAALVQYAKTPSIFGGSLLQTIIQRLEREDVSLPMSLVLSIYNKQIAGTTKEERLARHIDASPVLRLADNEPNAEFDRIIIELVDNPDDRVRISAERMLMKRKAPGADQKLKSVFANENLAGKWAARALVFQTGSTGVDTILACCAEPPEDADKTKRLQEFFGVLRDTVTRQNIPSIKRLGSSRIVADLIAVAARDAMPPQRVLMHRDRETLEEYCERYWGPDRKQWISAARTKLQSKDIRDGSDFCFAASVLHRNAETKQELGDLVVPYLDSDCLSGYFAGDALSFLAAVAQERHRPQFERFRDNDQAELRLYSLAGLARLGESVDRNRLARMIVLSPDSKVRFYADLHVLPTFDKVQLVADWDKDIPGNDPVAEAVHAFVTSELEALPTNAEMEWMY